MAGCKQSVICKLHCRRIPGGVNASGLSEVFARRELPSILGGNYADTEANRFSYWATEPREIFTFYANQDNPFDKLQEFLDRYKLEEGGGRELPAGIFRGGWVGYFSYELGRFIERLPHRAVDDLQMPLIRLCFYDRLICYDRLGENCWLIALEIPGEAGRAEEKLIQLEGILAESAMVEVKSGKAADMEKINFSGIRSNMSRRYYLNAIERIKNYIYEGDTYQVNFSQRFEGDMNGRAIDLYHWQNCYNPSPFAAYIDAGDFNIVSTSPEMFITVRDGLILTKPIKGTRPRISSSSSAEAEAELINANNFAELVDSEKDKAELNMIIDLERNDLGRICRYGSIKVVQPRTVETYPTVFHAVATVGGRLRDEISFCDVLKSVFPGGSITGAPKIRSMEIIDELEPTQRAVYTGSIGFIGIDGCVCLNIAIRTIIIKGERAFAQTGGGIVADSDAEAEWDETITKARALLAGIGAVQASRKPKFEIRNKARSMKFEARNNIKIRMSK